MTGQAFRLLVTAAAVIVGWRIVQSPEGPVEATQAFIADAATWGQSPPPWLIAAGVVVAVVFLVSAARGMVPVQTDPQRLFSAADRAEVFARAGHRCEHKPLLWMRCSGRATHADHIHPHSRGGATSLANGQALCQTHNLRKSNHIPSWVYVARLERRRRRYFPPNAQPKVRRRASV